MISDRFGKNFTESSDKGFLIKPSIYDSRAFIIAMTEDEDVMKILDNCDINISALKDELENFLKNNLNDLISDSQEEVKPTLGFKE